jgi:hypothetical protein
MLDVDVEEEWHVVEAVEVEEEEEVVKAFKTTTIFFLLFLKARIN